MCESSDDVGLHTADSGGAFWSPVGHRVAKFVKAERVVGDPVIISEAVANQHVHHGQHHCNVGARQWLDELVTGSCVDCVSGEGANWIDHDERCTVGSSCLDGRPEVTIGKFGVGSPQDDELAVFMFHWVEAARGANGLAHAGANCDAADRALKLGGSHVAEEPSAQPHE